MRVVLCPHCCLAVASGDECPYSELLAEFEQLVKNTKRPAVQKVLRRNQDKLVTNGAVSEEALQVLTKEELTKPPYSLLDGDAAALKREFASPTPEGV